MMGTTSRLSPEKQALLEQRLKGEPHKPATVSGIPKRPDSNFAPLSFAQRQMWVIDQVTPGNPAYNQPNGYRLRGPLQLKALEDSFNEVIKRHEGLRTTFAVKDGEPLQRVHPELTIKINVTELDHLTGDEREIRLQVLASEESVKSFDLSRLPLIRVSLFKLGEADHVLIINLHHIVADGLSVGLMLDELDTFYRAFTSGTAPHPPDLPVQYADFALWQRQTMANEAAYADQIEFWRKQFHGKLPVLELPGDRPRPALQSFKGSNVFFNIPKGLAQELQSLGAGEGCTFFVTLLAAFQVLLQRYSGAEDILIGTPVAARTPSEVEPLIGNFLNMATLRCDLSGNPTFIELLRRSRDRTLDAFSNSDLPFEAMVHHLKFERDPSRNAIFQVMLQVLSTTAPRMGDLEICSFHFDLKIAQFDLSLHLYEEVGGYRGRFEYCTDLFHAVTVEGLSSNFEQLLRAIVRNPQQRIAKIPILGASERNQILNEWNDTEAEFPVDALFHDLFEAQAKRTPERAAVRVGATTLSYAELDTRAARMAQALRSCGVSRGQRVGLCVERGADMLAAVLGILRAGAAYVPLDPSFPEERLRFMADDAQLALLVSTTALASPFGLPRERQLLLDADAKTIASAPDTRLPVDACTAQPEDPAYVIYTSGSTGKPKGVVVPHRAVVNFLTSMAREPGLAADDVLVAVTTLSFDIAVLELQLPLTLGAMVVIALRDEAIDGHALRSLLEQHCATVMQATPATWRLLLEAGWTSSTPFKALVGGEAMPKNLADQLIARGVELWNLYGPTETTVWSTCARITDTSNGITIGKPIANTTVWILDTQKNLCPIDVPGELCIGGDGVSLGYWRRPELTADRFVPDPFGTSPGATLYRTGDRARWRNDGTLEHLGRLDFQVKLRGYRIEPGEIEAAIARHPAIREVVVIAREDAPGDTRLVAYLVAEHPPADLVDQLRVLIRASMPEYMVPAHFVSLEALPLTENGKVDRKALPGVHTSDHAFGRSSYVAPRNDLETSLATVWERLLGVQRVGITDNFFELGGNSLGVIKLILEMENATGIEIDLGDVFRSQTIAELVTHFSPEATKNASVVVPLQREGSGIPIFCLCGINIYKKFAESLGKDQPVFGVYVAEEQALVKQAIIGNWPDVSIERLSEAYYKAIARFCPHGPYRLAGLSFGGVLAMEVASRMRKLGAEVDLVILLDTMLPQGLRRSWTKWFSRQAAEIMNGNAGQTLRGLLGRLRDRLVKRRLPSGIQNRVNPADEASAIRQLAFVQATRNWQARQLVSDYRVILFQGSDRSSWGSHIDFEEDYGWRHYLRGPFCIVNVSGNHLSIMESPNVAELGRKAQQYLGSEADSMKFLRAPPGPPAAKAASP